LGLAGSPSPHDEDSIVLASPEETRTQAVIVAGEMLQDVKDKFWSSPE